MGQGIFITGTDTGVGKTFFACALARLLKESGYKVGVMKPAESGCPERGGQLFPEDAARLKEASGCDVPLEIICPYRFRAPLAPSVAAEREGVMIDVDRLMAVYREIRSACDVILVEGAGGLMVPLLPSYTYADFARVMELPVIVVAANRLGVINHLLLTLEHAGCKGLKVLAYALNQTEAQLSLAAESNRATLSMLTAVPCLGEIPYSEAGSAEKSAMMDLFCERLDLAPLAAAFPASPSKTAISPQGK